MLKTSAKPKILAGTDMSWMIQTQVCFFFVGFNNSSSSFLVITNFGEGYHIVNCCVFVAMMPSTSIFSYFDGFYTLLTTAVI